jgi:steroid delta-isomerase-like uncharacterized protein
MSRKSVVLTVAAVLLLSSFDGLLGAEERQQRGLIDEPSAQAQAEIRQIIDSIVSDAASANIAGLQASHLDSERFTKFGPRRFERQGVAATNESEAAFFGSISEYQQESKDLEIDVFGDVAIATYYPHVSFVQNGELKQGSGRQTLVFLKTSAGWKIVHEHGTRRPTEGGGDRVRVRNLAAVHLVHAEIWSKGNVDLIADVYAEEFVGHFPAGTVHGREGVRTRVIAHRKAFPDWTEEVEDTVVDRDRVVMRFTSRGTNSGEFLGKPATGNRVAISEVAIFRLSDGKVVEQWVYPDMRSMQRQLEADGATVHRDE